MMNILSEVLINHLQQQTKKNIENVQYFQTLNEKQLNKKNSPKTWSILECIAHLNFYSDFYLQEFNRCLDVSIPNKKQIFKSGWFGNYSAKKMLPTNGHISKMKAFKHMNPIYSKVDIEVLSDFLKQQKSFLTILEKSKNIDLNKTRCKLTIPFITFNMGDTFRFYNNHNERHIIQANKIVSVNF